MAKEAEEGARNFKQIIQRTAEATQTSVSTVKQIVHEIEANKTSDSNKMPGITVKTITNTEFDNSKIGLIKRFIHTFHLKYKEFPTVKKLVPELQNIFNIYDSEHNIKKLIKAMGFRWEKTNKSLILLEKWNIRLNRIEYLEQLKRYSQDGRTVVFTGELYLEPPPEQKAKWKCHHITVVHAGFQNGFIPNALLVFASLDSNCIISNKLYIDWLEHQLIPNLPPQSVVVTDTSPPHNMEYDPAPSSNAKKCDMQAWLSDKGIIYDVDMYKPQLFQLIKNNKDRFKQLTLDKMLKDNGHDILRLPPLHLDLNPIETVWAAIRTHVNLYKEFDVKQDLIKEKVNEISPEDWMKMCTDVTEIEDIYRKNEPIIEALSEEIVSEMDSSSESDDSDSSSASDDDHNMLS